MAELTTLFLKLPRGCEVTPESAQNFLAALTQINSASFFQKLKGQLLSFGHFYQIYRY